jgi:hypothetical protein
MFVRKRGNIQKPSFSGYTGNNRCFKYEISGSYAGLQVRLVSPHTIHLENKLLHIRKNLVRCSKATWGISYSNLATVYKHAILPVITYAAEAWHSTISKRTENKLQQIQRSFLIFLTKAYRSVSLDALQAIADLMPIEQAVSLHKDIREISRGHILGEGKWHSHGLLSLRWPVWYIEGCIMLKILGKYCLYVHEQLRGLMCVHSTSRGERHGI